jgi:hypothetical protein
MSSFGFIESINSAKWNLSYHWFLIYSQKNVPMKNIVWLKEAKTK